MIYIGNLTILLCPSAGKRLSSIIELDCLVDLVVETQQEVEQQLEVVQHLVGKQAPVFLPDRRTVPSTPCVLCPNFLDPSMCIVPAHPRALALFEKVLYHFLS
jgi:hypothetical protein